VRSWARTDRAPRPYVPANPHLDGRFRSVEVKVKRPGLAVRYQHGYYAANEVPAVEMQAILTAGRLRQTGSASFEATSIGVTADATAMPAIGGKMEVLVHVTIDASQLALPLTESKPTGRIDLQIYAGDANERVVGEWNKRLDLSADEPTYQAWLHSGIRQTVHVPVAGKPNYIKVTVL